MLMKRIAGYGWRGRGRCGEDDSRDGKGDSWMWTEDEEEMMKRKRC